MCSSGFRLGLDLTISSIWFKTKRYLCCKKTSDIETKSFIAFFVLGVKYGAKDATTGDWNGKQSVF